MAALETVRAMLAAFDERDVDEYVSHLAEDVVVRPPGFIFGQREHHGREEVRAAFAEILITPERGDRFGTQTALLVTMTGDEVSRIDSWPSEAEGLAQLDDPTAVVP
ncbi:MAG TPA: nuclear transport factor 2 family protein [Solirubrobacterales bacterium]